MTKRATWTILGNDELSDELRAAAQFINATESTTVTTDPDNTSANAIASGSALLAETNRSVISTLLGIRMLEDLQRDVKQTKATDLYGCFASHRVVTETNPDAPLVDLLAYALELFQSPITRVHAQRASLRQQHDAWFVHLRARSNVLMTLEVMATQPAEINDELRVEVTSRERVWSAMP